MKRNYKKTLETVIFTTVLVCCNVFLCFAKDNSIDCLYSNGKDVQNDVYSIQIQYGEWLSKNSRIRQDYVFLGDDTVIPYIDAELDTSVCVSIYNHTLDIQREEPWVGIARFAMDEDDTTDITIRYHSDSDVAVPVFNIEDNYYLNPETLSCTKHIVKDNEHVLCMRLKQQDLDRISYFSTKDPDVFMSKIAGFDGNIIITSISIEETNGGFGVVTIPESNDDYNDKVADYSFTQQEGNSGAVKYSKNDDSIVISSIDAIESETGLFNENYSICEDKDLDYETATKYVKFEASANDDTELAENLDQIGENLKSTESVDSLLEIEIEDGEYCLPEEDDGGTVYKDNFVFLEEDGTGYIEGNASAVSIDAMFNIYTQGIDCGNNNTIESYELLGTRYEDLLISGKVFLLKVANNGESEYAGYLKAICNCDFDETQLIQATSSNATYTDNNEYLEKWVFEKPDTEEYSIEGETITLGNAMLKKASFAAVDNDGTICALYNSYGRLIELLDGYQESDVAYYLLKPRLSDNGEPASVSRIELCYNSDLSRNGAFAYVCLSDSNGELIEPSVSLSTVYTEETENKMYIAFDKEGKSMLIKGTFLTDNVELFKNDEYSATYVSDYYANEESDSEEENDDPEVSGEKLPEIEQAEEPKKVIKDNSVLDEENDDENQEGEQSDHSIENNQESDEPVTIIVPENEEIKADYEEDTSKDPVTVIESNIEEEIIEESSEDTILLDEGTSEIKEGDINKEPDINIETVQEIVLSSNSVIENSNDTNEDDKKEPGEENQME